MKQIHNCVLCEQFRDTYRINNVGWLCPPCYEKRECTSCGIFVGLEKVINKHTLCERCERMRQKYSTNQENTNASKI